MSVQRNDPCPCGSGRKYKRCCQRGNAPGSSPPMASPRPSRAHDEILAVAPPKKAPAPVLRVPENRPAILSVDRIQDLQRRLRRTLDEFDLDHGLKSSVGDITYSHESGHMTVETAIIRQDGVVMNRQARAYLHRAHEYGLSPEWLGRSFVCGGDHVRIIGLKPRAKESVILESLPEPGKPTQTFKTHPSQVAAHFM